MGKVKSPSDLKVSGVGGLGREDEKEEEMEWG